MDTAKNHILPEFENGEHEIPITSSDIRETVEILAALDTQNETTISTDHIRDTIATIAQIDTNGKFESLRNAPANQIALVVQVTSDLSTDTSVQKMSEQKSGEVNYIRQLFTNVFGDLNVNQEVRQIDKVKETVTRILGERSQNIGDVLAYLGAENIDKRASRTKNSIGLFAVLQRIRKFIPAWHQFAAIRTGEGIAPTEDKHPYGERITMDPGSHFREVGFTKEIQENLNTYELWEQKAIIVYKEIEDFFQDTARRMGKDSIKIMMWKADKEYEVTVTESDYSQSGDLLIAHLAHIIRQISQGDSSIEVAGNGKIVTEPISLALLRRNHHLVYKDFSKASTDPILRKMYAGNDIAVLLDDKKIGADGFTSGIENDPRNITAGFLRKVISFGVEDIQDEFTGETKKTVTRCVGRFNHRFYHGDPAKEQTTRVLSSLDQMDVPKDILWSASAIPEHLVRGVRQQELFAASKEIEKEVNEKHTERDFYNKREFSDIKQVVFEGARIDWPRNETVDIHQLSLPPEWFTSYRFGQQTYEKCLDLVEEIRAKYKGIERAGKSAMQLSLADISLLAVHTAYRAETATSIAKHEVGGRSSWDTYFNVFPAEYFDTFDEIIDLVLTQSNAQEITPQMLENVWSKFVIANNDFVTKLGSQLQVGLALMQREKQYAMRGEGTQSFFSTLFGRKVSLESIISMVSKSESLAGNVMTEAINNPQVLVSIMGGMKKDEKTMGKLVEHRFVSAQDSVYYRKNREDKRARAGSIGFSGFNEGEENSDLVLSNRVLPNQCYPKIIEAVKVHASRQGYPFDASLQEAVRIFAFDEDPTALTNYYDSKGWDFYKMEVVTLINKSVKEMMTMNLQRVEISTFVFLKVLEEYALKQHASKDNPIDLTFREKKVSQSRSLVRGLLDSFRLRKSN